MAVGPDVFSNARVPTREVTHLRNSRPRGLANGVLGFIWCAVIGFVCVYSSAKGISRLAISRMPRLKKG
jgi:hypothetical protein